jgi:hypothetical protein
MHTYYRIHIQEPLDPSWEEAFDGLTLHRQADGTTHLHGPVIDQAALHGILARIRDLKLTLVAVQRVEHSD